MPKLNVKKSIEIKKDKATIKAFLANFHNWKSWSPWLITEPEAAVNVREDGKYYNWEGNRIGSGEMTITAVTDSKIEYDLTFLKPWKSKAKTSFSFVEANGSTIVSWNMASSLPFFLFFMKKQTEAFIGMDYERGLKMLKEQLEQGQVSSKLSFLGISNFEGCNYIGIKRAVSMSDMPNYMGKDFENLINFVSKNSTNYSKDWFTQYHKFDMVKNKVIYTACIGVTDTFNNLPQGWISSSIPSCKLHTVRHQGPYDYVGNAWSASQMMIRAKVFKPKKGVHPIEFYRNSPQEVTPEQLISDICFAVIN